MRLFTHRIANLDIGWNERPMSEDDFYAICASNAVCVEEMALTVEGLYFRVLDKNVIAVDSRLSGPQRLAVLFHELAHCLFHAPTSGPVAGFHGIGRQTRKEREADVFALCAVIPKVWLENRSPQELVEVEAISREMLERRFEIYRLYCV